MNFLGHSPTLVKHSDVKKQGNVYCTMPCFYNYCGELTVRLRWLYQLGSNRNHRSLSSITALDSSLMRLTVWEPWAARR